MHETILVADDNEPSLRLVTDLLEFQGYRVLKATDGQQALNIARESLPDLVLMDMQMPVLDGFEAIRQLRADVNTAGLKIIAVTSYAMAEEKRRILAAGANGYMVKPIDTRKLTFAVQQMLADDSQS